MPDTESGRYNEQESLAAQSFATGHDNIEFSDQASPEAYAEAEQMIGELRKEKYAWMGIDWDNVDLHRMDNEVMAKFKVVLDYLEERGYLKQKRNARRIGEEGGIALMILLAIPTLGTLSKTAIDAARDYYLDHHPMLDRVEASAAEQGIVLPGEGWHDDDRAHFKKWMEEHPEVARIVIGELTRRSTDAYDKPLSNSTETEFPVTIILKNGDSKMFKQVCRPDGFPTDLGDSYPRSYRDPGSLSPSELDKVRKSQAFEAQFALNAYISSVQAERMPE